MRKLLIIGLVGLLLATVACHQKDKNASGEEEFGPKELLPDKPETNAETGGTTIVVAGDVVVVELTVYHPPFVYLTGESPVTVMAPVEPHCVFEQALFPMKVARFPLEVRFQITPRTAPASFVLRLGLRINYAYKSDEKPLYKNTLIDVPLKIVPIAEGHAPKMVRIPLEHFLTVSEDGETATQEKATP